MHFLFYIPCRFQNEVQHWGGYIGVDSRESVNFAPWIEEEASSGWGATRPSNRFNRHAEIVETDGDVVRQLRFYDFRRRSWLKFARPWNALYISLVLTAQDKRARLKTQTRFSKNTSLKALTSRPVTQEQLNRAQYQINERPRKKLGFSTPKILFFGKIS